jgi:molybdenum-dependent DNA-binding transcriptional regulator ModE
MLSYSVPNRLASSTRELEARVGRPLEFAGEKKQAFLEALERTECLRSACAAAGVMPGSVAWARKSDAAFAAALEAAIARIREGKALVDSLGSERVEARADGFTAQKRRRYLKTLAKTGCRSDAAKVAGISRNTADRWRRKDAGFAKACAAAIDQASSHIDTLAWERAVTGIEEPVFHCGKVVGTRIKRSDAIFRMLLIGSNKKKYGRMGPARRKEIEKELRQRIEREVRERIRAMQSSPEEVEQSLLRKLKAMRTHKLNQEGYSEGPDGQLVPPGWKMVPAGEGPAPE